MNWSTLKSVEDFDGLMQESGQNPHLDYAIFKHSTRCPVSSMAKFSIQRDWEKNNPQVQVYLIDIIRYREVSNHVEHQLNVKHESPQLILIRNCTVKYHASHSGISTEPISH